MKVRVKVETELLNDERWTKAINIAQQKTKSKGLAQLRSLTPIDTGLMNRSWQIEPSRLNLYIDNPVEYSGFIDKGTRYIKPYQITEKSLPVILTEYEQNIVNEIDKIK